MDASLGSLSSGGDADAVARNVLGSAEPGRGAFKSAFENMDSEQRAALLGKTETVVTTWRKMQAEVTKALSAKTPSYPIAQSALDSSMNIIKTEMRTVSKALSGGDITVRDITMGGVDQPQFDYNTGAFKLQPLAQQAEDVYKVVNILYFDNIKARAKPELGLATLAKADGQFNDWLTMIRAAEASQDDAH